MSGSPLPPECGTCGSNEQIELRARPRGFHLVTSEILDAVPELESMSTGIAVVFMQHTSASLTINENASPDVRRDFAEWFDRAVPDGADYFAHTLEGPDDMPAHIKASLTGAVADDPGGERLAGAGNLAGASTCASSATTAAPAGWSSRRSGD